MAADLIVRILTDATEAAKGIDKASSQFGQFEAGMKSLAIPAAAVATGVGAIGVASVNAASDLQQSFGAIDAVFGDSAGQIKEWARASSDAVGLSTAEYGQFASTIGAQLKNLGVPMDQVGASTNELIKLGSDLAATYGGTTQQAVDALSSALRGEADPAERYGLALNQTAVNAELAAQGLTGLEGQALTAAKAQTIMQLATEQAGGAIGQFGRESDTVAGQTQRMQAEWTNAAAALGTQLLPFVTAGAQALSEFAGWVQQNSAWILPLIAGIGALAAAILVINGAIAAYNAILAVSKVATTIATAAQWLWNAALTANPIGIIIAAVAALVAGFIYLWNTNEGFRNFFISLWESIAAFFSAVWEGAMAVVGAVVSWFQSAWAAVAAFFQSVWQTAVAVVQAYIQGWANIIGAVINGVRAVVNAVVQFFVQAWQNGVNTVNNVMRQLQSIFNSVFNAIMVPINAVVGAFNNIVGAVKNVIHWISQIKIPDVFGAIGGFFGGGGGAKATAFSAPAPAAFSAFAAPAISAYSGPGIGGILTQRSAAAAGGNGTTIQIMGGLDSADAIARRIQTVLTQRERRTGGVTIARAAR